MTRKNMGLVHLIAPSADARQGGMESAVVRLANHLIWGQHRVALYTLSDAPDSRPAELDSRAEFVPLGRIRAELLEPVSKIPGPLGQAEMFQAEFLILRNELRKRAAAYPAQPQMVLSWFLRRTGMAGQQLAEELSLPHITTVLGSDFNRDFRDPQQLPALLDVCRRATRVAVTNEEQQRALIRYQVEPERIEVIHNSVSVAAEIPPARTAEASEVHLVSDGGFSFKKGTHLLISAVKAIRSRGAPVRAHLFGATEPHRVAYWKKVTKEAEREHPGVFHFEGWVEAKEITARLHAADLYCSATLGEGSSAARLRALLLGMPMVATDCASLAEYGRGLDHVRLAPPGDPEAFRRALAHAVEDWLAGTLRPDPARVRELAERFRPEEERARWCRLVESVEREFGSRRA